MGRKSGSTGQQAQGGDPLREVLDRARERMRGFCRVCPVCDGSACAGQVPGLGGIGSGASFAANCAALARLALNQRLLHDAGQPDTRRTLLGFDLALPVLAAPICGVSFNLGRGVSERRFAEAMLAGCREAGTIGCTGDGAPPEVFRAALSAIEASGGQCIPFIKPWLGREFADKLRMAEAAGARVVGVDLDGAGFRVLAEIGRPVGPRPAGEWREVIGGLRVPVALKGVMTPDEALLAVDAGACAIVVSNHGGRVLDHTPGVAEALPAVVRAVGGRIPILADGCVRSGGDVLKLLALGADAVLVGRPLAVAAMGGLARGVGLSLRRIKAELEQAMLMTGCADLSAVTDRVLFRGA